MKRSLHQQGYNHPLLVRQKGAKRGELTIIDEKRPGLFADLWAEEAFMWPRAERYAVAVGWITAEGPRRKEDRKSGPRYLNLDRKSPLSDPSLLHSFAGLVSRGTPSNHRLKAWVSKYGLPKRRDSSRDGDEDLKGGEVNQEPMMVQEFLEEARFARDLTHLYYDVRAYRTDAIRRKIAAPKTEVERLLAVDPDIREAVQPPTGSPDGPFARRSLLKLRMNLRALPTRAPDALVLHAEAVFRGLLSRRLAGVRLDVGSGFLLPEGLGERPLGEIKPGEWADAKKPPGRYRPVISWSCPDLLSAIYLQILTNIVRDKPMSLCANPACGAPFFPSRRDKVYCTEPCKQQAKYLRK